MKIKIGVFLVLCVVLFSSCDQLSSFQRDRINLNQGYQFKAAIEYMNTTWSADVARVAENEWSATLNEPFALQGLQMQYKDGSSSLSLAGFSVDVTDIPGVKLNIEHIIKAFEDAVLGEGAETKASGEQLFVTGDAEEVGKYTLTLDGKTAAPIKLELHDLALNITFSDVVTGRLVEADVVPAE